ncbi:hypothetical protein D3C81_1680950 [compost metagenome]
MLLPGPVGWRQSAPGTKRHQRQFSRSGTGPLVATKTIAPATIALSGGRGVPGGSWTFMVSQSGARSAVVR